MLYIKETKSNKLTHLMFFLMCAGLEGLEGLEPFEDFDDLGNLEFFCFLVLLEGGLLLVEFSGLAGT